MPLRYTAVTRRWAIEGKGNTGGCIVTEADWWARVEEAPGDHGLFMFFADWLGDQGDSREGVA